MIIFMTSCFDLLFDLIKSIDNIIVFLPCAAIFVSFLFCLTYNMIRGKYYD